MSHNIESMAYYSAEKPWHNLGVAVSNDLSAEEMMIASKTNWRVEKYPIFTKVGDTEIQLIQQALVRDSDNSILDIVGEDWIPKQNIEAFEFFKEFVDSGKMTMETAGSLQSGKIVWVLAKVGKNFDLFGGDKVESYLLFSNPHKYGFSIDVRFTAVRVVCNNTLTMALNGKADKVFKSSHRIAVSNEMIKETLKIVDTKMEQYEETASFLGSKMFDPVSLQKYFDEVFPILSKTSEEKSSKNSKLAMAAIQNQPGIQYAAGSFWQALNAVTYVTDHMMGRNDDTRVHNAWYGSTATTKLKAMKLAVDYAKNS